MIAGFGRWALAHWYAFTTGLGVALSALLSNKFRAGLTALGIVIGVMTVTGILSIIHGLDRGVENQMSLMGVHSLYVSRWPWATRGHWYKYRNRSPITDWQYRRLRELVPFAEAMAPREQERTRVERGDEKITDVEVTGTNSELSRITGYTLESGRAFSPADIEFERPFVVLGSDVAEQLFDRGKPLGKYVLIQGMRYQVIGVLKSQGSFLGRSRDVTATIPIGRFRREFGSRHDMDIAIRVVPGVELDEAEAELQGLMRRVRGLRPQQEDNFSINQQKVLGKLYSDITGTLFMVIVIVGMISLLVGGIGIMNIMLVSVTERTREIGIRKALGARRSAVLFQFLIESLVLSGLGGLIGLGIGFLVAYIVDAVSPLPASISMTAVVGGLGFSIVVGVFFGIYPAWRASRLNPIVALRYE
ncbi:MAG TPA: ABC transporter permease [Myxococcota bacterium]|nr:ABC transporter permease [Myxococcota bacterium]